MPDGLAITTANSHEIAGSNPKMEVPASADNTSKAILVVVHLWLTNDSSIHAYDRDDIWPLNTDSMLPHTKQGNPG